MDLKFLKSPPQNRRNFKSATLELSVDKTNIENNMPRFDNVDLRLLRVFLAVVESGGFSAAQTRLNVSASTVSNQISSLETRLGVRLCRRGRTGFKLTPEGETVYGELLKLLTAVEEFDMGIASLRNRLKGSLAIGMVDSTVTDSSAALHSAIRRAVGRMPGVHLTLECRPPNELLRDIMERKLDVAIGSFPKILLGLHYVRLYEERHFMYCGRGHPLFDQPVSGTALVDEHPIIWRGYWARRDSRHLHTAPPAATVNTMEAAATLILSGRFLGYLPDHYAEPWVAAGEMRSLLPDQLTYLAPFELAFADNVSQRRPARIMIEEVLRTFAIPNPASFHPEESD